MSKVAKYFIVKQDIINKINTSEFKPNQIIPSENELCKQYNVSRITIRKAIDELVFEGLLYRLKGKGCFIREHENLKISRIYSFTEAIKNAGKIPSKKQIFLKKELPNEEISKKLELKKNDYVYIIKCIYFADDIPYCLNTSYLPEKYFSNLHCFNFNDNSLYQVLRTFYNTSFTRAKQVINSVICEDEICDYLQIKEKKAILKIDAVSYGLYEDIEKALEIYESYILTDILSYIVEKYNN